MCDVSVIIPTYNRLEFLQEAVASVLAQTLPPQEIHIVDDGSTDGTWEWLQSLSSARIQVIRQNNRGPAAARNEGARCSGGKFLAFLDSDDLWLPEKLQTQMRFFAERSENKICQTEEIWIRDGRRVNPHKKHQKPSGWIFEKCLPLCLISPSAMMVERRFFEELGGFDPSFPVCEDYDLWLRASLRAPVTTLPERLTVKRGGHPDQLSQKFPAMDRFRVESMLKVLSQESLTDFQKEALLSELQKKLEILARGFQKRFPTQLNPYQDKILWLQKNHLLPAATAASAN